MRKIILLPSILFCLIVSTLSQPFETINAFHKHLNTVCAIEDETERENSINSLWSWMESGSDIPFAIGDSAVFLYRGDANKVQWAGDMNGWNPSTSGYTGEKVGLSNVWINTKSFPSDSRIDYKIVLNGNNWILDPDNNFKQMSGFGWNSELRMPDWEASPYVELMDDVNRGELSTNIKISSSYLNYDLQYKVYTPFNYESLDKLPVVYVTDGHEYANNDMGSMIIVLDNLIHLGLIQPIIAVFIDPRNPNNLSQNRREDEYTCNDLYASFVADELVPFMDANYKTNPYPYARGILGTSYGGNNSGYFASTRSDKFGLIMAHSPAFFDQTIDNFKNSEKLPVNIFLTTGMIYDTYEPTLKLRNVLDEKEYEYQYIEVNEGHSWGNWRALLDDMLIHFFSETISINEIESENTDWSIYPNPVLENQFYLVSKGKKTVTLDLYAMDGRKVVDFGQYNMLAGEKIALNTSFSEGLYFLRIKENKKQIAVLQLIK